MPRFFRLQDDKTADQRWYLSGPAGPNGEWLDDALMRGQEHTGPHPLQVRLTRPGPALELTLTTETIPIVSRRVADLLRQAAPDELQLIPATVAGAEGPLFAVNILPHPACIDERASGPVAWWTDADGRPEMLGQYKRLGQVRIDADRARNHNILRPAEWPVAVIVSQFLADALQGAGVQCHLSPAE
jgi:uncharacterized protein DUF1629